jgi:hypothetical protein
MVGTDQLFIMVVSCRDTGSLLKSVFLSFFFEILG